ncbi:hypothetical protein D3C77_794310 [compost metagenome]
MGKPHSKRVVDDVADGCPVAGSGETVGKAPVFQCIRHRAFACFYIGQNFNCSGYSPAQSHVILRIG